MCFLRFCRSSSVNFVLIFRREIWEIWWEFGGIFAGFCLTHRIKAQKFRGKFRGIFRKKIRSSKKSFVQNSLCRRAMNLNKIWGFRGPGFRSARQALCGDALTLSGCRLKPGRPHHDMLPEELRCKRRRRKQKTKESTYMKKGDEGGGSHQSRHLY